MKEVQPSGGVGPPFLCHPELRSEAKRRGQGAMAFQLHLKCSAFSLELEKILEKDRELELPYR